MNKIKLIIKREYLTRVRKKSFIIMTFLTPILLGGIMFASIYFATKSDKIYHVGVVDNAIAEEGDDSFFEGKLKDTESIKFIFLDIDYQQAKAVYNKSGFNALLTIPDSVIDHPEKIKLESHEQLSLMVTSHIENRLRKEIEAKRLSAEIKALNLGSGYEDFDRQLMERIKVRINLRPQNIDTGKESYTEVRTIIGTVAGFLIYIFIFMFGSQVMRGVIEEKISRIVEVIISSVKPFQLMMGKIIGIAMVGLTQFLLWIILSGVIFGFLTMTLGGDMTGSSPVNNPQVAQEMINEYSDDIPMMEGISTENTAASQNQIMAKAQEMLEVIPVGKILIYFLFYFIFGYLLYASLFAAIGSAVDSETETQQFMLPVTIPLILSIMMLSFVMNNPNGPVAFWFSIIPLTSPVIMMIRAPFDPPLFDVVLSMVLLVAGFVFSTWAAGKIYRTGILMYGKKVSYKEIWKWFRYSN